jgi:hypothetical protein
LVAAPQVYGAQETVGPIRHDPLPSQIFIPVIPDPAQAPESQMVPFTNLRQPPLPSQVLSWPQLEAGAAGHSLALRGLAPAGTASQVPSEPGRLHDMHFPVHADLQQTPSTQNPLPQSEPHEQGCPRLVAPVPLLLQPGGRSVPASASCPASTEATGASRPPSLVPVGAFPLPPQSIANTRPAQKTTAKAPFPRMKVTPAG